MTGTRLTLPVLAALVLAVPADAGSIFGRKGKSDARVRQLADTLRTDPDEKKRRAAVAELKEADPRAQTDVILALVAALQRDPVPQVRADAAEAIGQFKQVFPIAGVALEAAAESDLSPGVRDTAQQALWEYHLNGYRSARGADGIAGQTPEPPLAAPRPPRVAFAPLPPLPVGGVQPAGITDVRPTIPSLPTATLPPPPSTSCKLPPDTTKPAGPRVILTAAPPLHLNLTSEPPLAKPPQLISAPAPAPDTATAEAAPPSPALPVVVPTPAADLPAIPLPPTPTISLPTIPALPK